MTIKETIINHLASGEKKVDIKYGCHTTSTNGEYITVSIGGTECYRSEGCRLTKFNDELIGAVNSLAESYPDIHILWRMQEFHFFYSGFNSCHTENAPQFVSVSSSSEEVQKLGIVKETHKLVGKNKVLEMLQKYPDYELYYRCGFSFRGAQEMKVDYSAMEKFAKDMYVCDISVVDNEIHVNEFTANDMY